MNKRSFVFLTLVLLTLVFAGTGCKKDKTTPAAPIHSKIDHRLAFTGNYSFMSCVWYINYYTGTFSTSDTVYYNGTISIVPGTDSLIRISYRPYGSSPSSICSGDTAFGDHVVPAIDLAGLMNKPMRFICSVQSDFTGSFVTPDSLSISVNNGGQVTRFGHTIRGKKL